MKSKPITVSEAGSLGGKIGGKSKSKKKLAAIKKNLKKANKARYGLHCIKINKDGTFNPGHFEPILPKNFGKLKGE